MARSEVLERQWALYYDKEYALAFEETLAFVDKLQGSDLRDAQRLLGLACLRQQQYTQASLWFKKACQGSENAGDWLNLATSSALHSDMELSAQAFEQVRLIQQAARYHQGPGFYRQLFGYASALCEKGEYQHLQPLLDELAQAYHRVHSTDTAFLYVVGLPFLSSFLALAAHRFDKANEHAKGIRWLQALGKGLDEDGQRQVAKTARKLLERGGLAP